MKRLVISACITGALLTMGMSADVDADGAGQPSSAFNPSISMILNGTYAQMSRNPANYAIAGFPLTDGSDPGSRGFSIGESELGIRANIDPDWFGFMTFSMAGDGTSSVENACAENTNLGHGLTVKIGRFFSGIGYLNEQHSHTWDFVTALAYRALLGTQYRDDGVQVRWLAPTDLFVEVGSEWMRGDAFPAGGSANNGRGTWTGFVHVGDDVGISNSWCAGLSYLSAKADGRKTGTNDLFSGDSKRV